MAISYLSCFAIYTFFIATAFTVPPSAASPLAASTSAAAASLLSKFNNKNLPNSTFPLRVPVTLPSSLSSNVPDPWEIPVFGTYLTIEWYNYGNTLPLSKTQDCVMAAIVEAAHHIWTTGEWNMPMGSFPYSYTAGRVTLYLRVEPGKTLIWGHWWNVLYFFPDYLAANAWRGTHFNILWDRFGVTNVIAVGQLL